jgi:hypothetical protein
MENTQYSINIFKKYLKNFIEKKTPDEIEINILNSFVNYLSNEFWGSFENFYNEENIIREKITRKLICLKAQYGILLVDLANSSNSVEEKINQEFLKTTKEQLVELESLLKNLKNLSTKYPPNDEKFMSFVDKFINKQDSEKELPEQNK